MSDRAALPRRDLFIRVFTGSLLLTMAYLGGCCGGSGPEVGPDGVPNKARVPEGVKNMQEFMKEQMAKKRGGKAKQK